MYKAPYRNQEYRTNEVMGASPLQLVIMAYDVAIRACHQQDFEKATRAISLLRDALNFDYPEVAIGLFRIYQWCLDCIRQGDYESAAKSLTELRGAWKATEDNLSGRSLPGTLITNSTGVGAGIQA